jgi:hypothetical protein
MEAAGLLNGGLSMNRTDLDLAGRSLPMVPIHVKKHSGFSTLRPSVTAPTIEQMLLLAREGARVVFPKYKNVSVDQRVEIHGGR